MKVKFENLEQGWIDFEIKDNSYVILSDRISYISNSLSDLVDSLYQLSIKNIFETKIIFLAEPFAYELCFYKRGESIELKIFFIENYVNQRNYRILKYEIKGNRKNIAIPFWRALRGLQSKYTQEEFNKLWQADFSYQKLEKLSMVIKK